MKDGRVFPKFLLVSMIFMYLVGCTTPTTATSTVRYQPGHYTGKPGVSFDVMEDETIQNFKISVTFGLSTCTIKSKPEEVLIIEDDGSFIVAGSKADSDGKLSMNSVVGRFTTPATVEGEYSNAFMCDTQLIMSSNQGKWSAQLESAEIPKSGSTQETSNIKPTPSISVPEDQTQELLIREITTSDWVSSIGFSPDGAILVAGLYNGDLELITVADGSRVEVLPNHTSNVYCMEFSPDGQLMATGGAVPTSDEDQTLHVWSVSDWKMISTLEKRETIHSNGVSSLAFSPDGKMLVAGSRNGFIHIWQVSDGILLQTLEGHEKEVESIAFSTDGSLLATAGYDDSVYIWQASDWSLLRTLDHENFGFSKYQDIVFLDNDATIAGYSAGILFSWNVSDGSRLPSLILGQVGFRDVTFSPDHRLLASASVDGLVQIWRVSDGKLLSTMAQKDVGSVAFSPDGKMLASSSQNGIRLWKIIDQ